MLTKPTSIGFGGFTLVELMVTISVTVVLAVSATLSYQALVADSRGRQCSANICLIENAKDQFSVDFPSVALTATTQLNPYLKYGFPTCPTGGSYSNLTNRYVRVACSRDDGVIDGFHDFQPR
jgi:prepilin-type N-terminal cleavage/methylation domain-containing protein